MQLDTGRRILGLESPIVMGVLNVTPDSFSDGGRYPGVDDAVRAALDMEAAGAAVIDLGGESTRPGAKPVSDQQQLDRVMPVLEGIRRESDAVISIDTGSAAVIRATTAAGAEMINDVYALRLPGALEAAAGTSAAVCLMHMQGLPATMQDDPRYDDLPGDIVRFLDERLRACRAAGIADRRLVVDPGFGFGKTHEHNLAILAELGAFASLGRPLLVGLSRKGTLGHITGRPADQRQAAGIAAAVMAVERGAHIVRTHDVAATVDALKITAAVLGSRHA